MENNWKFSSNLQVIKNGFNCALLFVPRVDNVNFCSPVERKIVISFLCIPSQSAIVSIQIQIFHFKISSKLLKLPFLYDYCEKSKNLK